MAIEKSLTTGPLATDRDIPVSREALNKLESAGCHDVAGAFQGAQKIFRGRAAVLRKSKQ
jgi:hypothetical protein